MKKNLLIFLFLLSFSLFATQKYDAYFATDNDDVIEIDISITPPVTGPKRMPPIIPISATCFVGLSYIDVHFFYDIGDVDIIVTNLDSCSSNSYSVHSSIGYIFLPFQSYEGNYLIEFITLSGTTYYGYFLI